MTKEYQVIVTRIDDQGFFYKVQRRSVGFFYRSKWKDVSPSWVSSYDAALGIEAVDRKSRK